MPVDMWVSPRLGAKRTFTLFTSSPQHVNLELLSVVLRDSQILHVVFSSDSNGYLKKLIIFVYIKCEREEPNAICR